MLDSEKAVVSFRQHWVPQGGNQSDRPHTCIGADCPLCEMGDRSTAALRINILDMSSSSGPKKILQIGIRAWNALKEAATSKKTGKIDLEKDFFTVSRSGSGNKSQTNFRPVKLRDIEEEWDEILENFDLADLDDIIEEAKEQNLGWEAVEYDSRRKLDEVAKYLSDG